MECSNASSRPEYELSEAVRRGDLLAAAFLIDKGVDVNIKTHTDAGSLLHCACKNNNFSMVLLLLSRGADRLSKNKSGQTPKELTTSNEILTLLLSNDLPRPKTDDSTHNIIPKQENMSNCQNAASVQDLLLKVRIANSVDPDFIEIELPGASITYQQLLNVCCLELEINHDQVSRIRKLPDTRIRGDADVKRLKPLQELEVVLREHQSSVINHPISANIYPSISADKNQTVLY